MPGHVFLVHGDLTSLACHDVLVPTDGRLNVTQSFQSLVVPYGPGDAAWVRPSPTPAIPANWSAVERDPLPLDRLSHGRRVWLVNTAVTGTRPDVNWLVEGVGRAVEHVAAHPAVPPDAAVGTPGRRARRLIALPLMGVSAGGFAGQRATVIRQLLVRLTGAVQADAAPDVAIVTYRRADYEAFQSLRTPDTSAWLPGLAESIERVADRAHNGSLVLFLGAGVSMAGGLPSWDELIAKLAQKVRLAPDVVAALKTLSSPDQATVVMQADQEPRAVPGALVELLRQDTHSIAHALLASLRVPEAITTNYDDMYEQAGKVPFGGGLQVLPAERVTKPGPWLLKLHGDISDPRHVVLAREEYLNFESAGAPLAALFQSRLFTAHVLFVGYSLADDTFIRLARQVIPILETSTPKGEPVGTVLTLLPQPAKQALWGAQLTLVPILDGSSSSDSDERSPAEAARQLEIVLDYLGWRMRDPASFLLDDTYEELISNQHDHDLRALLNTLADDAAGGAAHSAHWPQVKELLTALGWRPPDEA